MPTSMTQVKQDFCNKSVDLMNYHKDIHNHTDFALKIKIYFMVGILKLM